MGTLDGLQAEVAVSRTAHQRTTRLEERAIFLATECGEVLKEVLRLRGLYGPEAEAAARDAIARELCDVIWNACDLANQLDISLQEPMDEMLKRNAVRTYPGEKHGT